MASAAAKPEGGAAADPGGVLSSADSALEVFHHEHRPAASHRYHDAHLEIKEEDKVRNWLMHIINTAIFEKIMGLLIIINFVIIAMQVDAEASCSPLPEEFNTVTACVNSLPYSGVLLIVVVSLMSIYTVEAGCRFYVERMAYFKSPWNLLDLFVVFTGWVGEVMFDSSAFSVLRIMRTVRLVRMIRVLISFPELYYMLSSLMSLFKSLIFASGMLFALLSLWSIILVQYIHPISSRMDWSEHGCERCERAYSSIMHSNLTLWQHLVMGDSWGWINIPIIEQEPWTAAVLCSVVITVVLGLMNLIMAVILQRAEDARDNDKKLIAIQKEKEHEQVKRDLIKFCEHLDKDQSGNIDLEELVSAWHNHHEFRDVMKGMDIHEDDLAIVFRVLDKDNSGEVTYYEFCDELCKMQTRDLNTMMSIMRLSMTELERKVNHLTVMNTRAPDGTMSQEPRESKMRSPAVAAATKDKAATQVDRLAEQVANLTAQVDMLSNVESSAESWALERASSPTVAGKLFAEMLGARQEVAALSTEVLTTHQQELAALKLNVSDYFEKQVGMLVVALNEDWSKSGGAGRTADSWPNPSKPSGLNNGLASGVRSGGVAGGLALPDKGGNEVRAQDRSAQDGYVSVASLRQTQKRGQREPPRMLLDPGMGVPMGGGGEWMEPTEEDPSRFRASRV